MFWRLPEALVKTIRKEKMQLRNRTGAKGFRVRKKGEYIYESF
jgi:hypothetical protein